MDIDLPPITAFALEGSGLDTAEPPHTLTMPVPARGTRIPRLAVSTVQIGAARAAAEWPLRTGIGSTPSISITLSF